MPPPAWATLLIGCLGALVGAGGTIASQIVAARRAMQNEQRQRRSDAAIKLIAATYAVMDQSDHLVHTGGDSHGVQEARERYLEAWRSFHPAYAESLLTAPRALLPHVRAIRNTLYRLSEPTDSWYVDYSRRSTRADALDDTAWSTAHNGAETARRDYLVAARQVLPDLDAITEDDVPTARELGVR